MASSYTIGQRYETFIRELVRSGRYASASEVMRDGLRLLEEREDNRRAKIAALRDAIRDGMESGDPLPADRVFDELEARHRGDKLS